MTVKDRSFHHILPILHDSASFFLLASASWVGSAWRLVALALVALFHLAASASWVDSAWRLVALALVALFHLAASASWVDSAA